MKPPKPKPLKTPKPVIPMLRFGLATRRGKLVEGFDGPLLYKSGRVAKRAALKKERVALIEMREVTRGVER